MNCCFYNSICRGCLVLNVIMSVGFLVYVVSVGVVIVMFVEGLVVDSKLFFVNNDDDVLVSSWFVRIRDLVWFNFVNIFYKDFIMFFYFLRRFFNNIGNFYLTILGVFIILS